MESTIMQQAAAFTETIERFMRAGDGSDPRTPPTEAEVSDAMYSLRAAIARAAGANAAPTIPTDADAVHAMRQYGGEFVKQLAQLWLCADPLNQARVKLAFGDYFDRYREVAAQTKVTA